MQDINLQQLQELVNYVAETIGEKCKYRAIINPRLKRYYAKARTYIYAKTGRRRIEFSKQYLKHASKERIIKTIIHEIAHFKQSKYRKLRKQWLKYKMMNTRTYNQHSHTKAFFKLVDRLKQKFENNKK